MFFFLSEVKLIVLLRKLHGKLENINWKKHKLSIIIQSKNKKWNVNFDEFPFFPHQD